RDRARPGARTRTLGPGLNRRCQSIVSPDITKQTGGISMLVSVPRPQMPIALEPDGVRRLAGAQRQPQPLRLIAVLERSAFIRDAHGKKQQYVPFAERIVEEKHL